MIKKIFLALILCFVLVNCGKKGDPTYKDPKKETSTKSIFLDKA